MHAPIQLLRQLGPLSVIPLGTSGVQQGGCQVSARSRRFELFERVQYSIVGPRQRHTRTGRVQQGVDFRCHLLDV